MHPTSLSARSLPTTPFTLYARSFRPWKEPPQPVCLAQPGPCPEPNLALCSLPSSFSCPLGSSGFPCNWWESLPENLIVPLALTPLERLTQPRSARRLTIRKAGRGLSVVLVTVAQCLDGTRLTCWLNDRRPSQEALLSILECSPQYELVFQIQPATHISSPKCFMKINNPFLITYYKSTKS